MNFDCPQSKENDLTTTREAVKGSAVPIWDSELRKIKISSLIFGIKRLENHIEFGCRLGLHAAK